MPVNCATGTFWHTFTDASIPGLGIPLNLTRTYSSTGAATNSPLGYGWTDSYAMHLSFDGSGNATVTQENGSTVPFYVISGTYFPGAGVLASLVKNGDGTYTFTRHSTNTRYVLNSAGRLLKETDRNGYTTTLTYNGSDLTEVTDQAGRSLTFTYSGGHIVSISDPMGHTTTYTYDGSGNLVSTVDPLGRTWSFTYDPDHLLLTMTDPKGGITTNTYDSSDRVTKQVDPMGRTTTWSYTGEPEAASGGTTTITDPRGVQTEQHYTNLELTAVTAGVGTLQAATTSYEYDMATLGLTKITDPNGNVTTQTYDSRGDLLATTDPLAHVATYTYDSDGDLLTSTDPLGTTTTYTYDGSGNLLSRSTPLPGGGTSTWSFTYGTGATAGDRLTAKDPNGNTTTYGYDAAGNVISITDPLGHQSTASYDQDGRRLSQTTPKGSTTTYAYDADGEPTSETGPLGETTTYGYDAAGNRVSTTDANGHTTKQTFNADNELIQVTRPDGSTLRTERDDGGNTVVQIDGAGHATTHAYDPLGRVISTTDPVGNTTSYSYDAAGHETAMVNAEGDTTEYAYDAGGELTGIDYSDATTPDISQTYDANGRRTKLTDGTGTSEFTYDSLGRMTSSEDGAGAVIQYGYDPAGQLTTLTYPNGKSVTRGYDAAGNLTSVTDWQGHTSNFSYDSDGNLDEEQYPGNVVAQLEYDDADRLTAISDTKAGSTLARFDYTRDPVGQVISETANNGEAGTTNYSYNALEQLTAADATPYGYDAADNPTTFGAATQTFDAANELLSSRGPGEVTEPPNEEPPSGNKGSPAKTGSKPPTVDALVNAKSGRQKKLTTPTLRTHNSNDLIVAFISAAHGQRARAVTGAHLRWSRLARADGPGGATEIWQARATSRLNGPISIRLRHGGQPTAATITAFAGQSPYIAAYARSHGQASAPASRLTPPEGTTLWGVGHSTGQKRPIAAQSGQRLVAQVFNKRAHTDGWVQEVITASSATHIADKGRSAHWTLLAAASATRAAQTTGPADSAEGNPALSAGGGASGTPGLVTRQFIYNARGDRTEEATPGAGTRDLEYDQEDRLIAVGNNNTYSYNGDGLRVSKSAGTTTTPFVWNQTEPIPELLQSGSTSYLYGPGGMPIEQITEETPTFLHHDQQGSTRLLTDVNGAVVARYGYNPWGKVTSHTGTATTNLQFDGQYTDAESGLIYLRARYYDPATGVFISRDPLVAVTGSPYGYTANDPVNATDAMGMWSLKIWAEKKALNNYGDWLLDHWTPYIAGLGPGPKLKFAVSVARGFTAYGGILNGLEESAAGALSPLVAFAARGAAQLATNFGAPPWVSNGFNNLASLATWAGPQLRQLGYEHLRSGFLEAQQAGGEFVEAVWQLYNNENPNLSPPPGDIGGACHIPANWPPRPGV